MSARKPANPPKPEPRKRTAEEVAREAFLSRLAEGDMRTDDGVRDVHRAG